MTGQAPLKVMIADDSLLVRGLLRTIVETDPECRIVATCVDGESAVADYKSFRPDIVLMDIEMPNMDGLAALTKILEYDACARVIMCSSLTQSGAATTYRALEIGALDCLAKPSAGTIDRGVPFRDRLLLMIKALGRETRRPGRLASRASQNLHPSPANAYATAPAARSGTNYTSGATAAGTAIRPPESVRTTAHATSSAHAMHRRAYPPSFTSGFPSAIAIGASTGGPQALSAFFRVLDRDLTAPVFVTQHIPAGFADYMAGTLHKIAQIPVHVAREGQPVEPGHVYLAPPGLHMSVTRGVNRKIMLLDTPPVSFCKPAIDVMLKGLCESYGKHILAVMLTGMGTDGMAGCRALTAQDAQNIIIAQDEASSVVWGIPGAVAKAGLAHDILPLDDIAPYVNRLLRHKDRA